MKYDEIRYSKISDISEVDIKVWILDEITSLASDCGQNIDNEMTLHIGRRLFEKLNTTYRSWYIGDIHAVFQMGLSGAYGTFRKVTVQSLFSFLKIAQAQRSNLMAQKAENEAKNRVTVVESTVSEFLAWASGKMICLEYTNPGYNPIAEKRVSPQVMALADEYAEAKDFGVLHAFENRLRNEAIKYAEI